MNEENVEKRSLTTIEKILIGVIALSIILLIIFGIRLSKKMNPEVLSGDKAVCNRINTILEENSGNYIDYSVGDVINYLVTKGFLVENLTPTTSGNYYVYNASSKQFVLVSGFGNNMEEVFGKLAKKDVDNWVIVNTQNEFNNTTSYSHYLTSKFDGDKEIYIESGIDTSNCRSVKHIILNKNLKNEIVVSYNANVCDFINDSSTSVVEYNVY